MKAIITILVLVIIAVGIYLYARDRGVGPADTPDTAGTSTTTEMRVYTNQDYGFFFEYPPQFAVQEFNPEHVAIGSSTADGFNSVAEVTVLLDEDETTYGSYEQFLADRARVMCAADGPEATIGCTDIERESAFESTSGLTGVEFYLVEQTRNLQTGTTTSASKGPFYAFNLAANATGTPYAALIVHPPIAAPEDAVNAALIRSIARSVQINRTPTR